MPWPSFISRTHLLRGIVISVFCLLIGIGIFVLMKSSSTTYVKIIDQASLTKDTSPSPGADIRAISLEHGNTTTYVNEVISFVQHNQTDAAQNSYANTTAIVGEWNDKKTPPHLALSRGGEVLVHINSRNQAGDTLHIYETGLSEGRTAEYYEVFISTSEKGPWTSLGIHAGESSLILP